MWKACPPSIMRVFKKKNTKLTPWHLHPIYTALLSSTLQKKKQLSNVFINAARLGRRKHCGSVALKHLTAVSEYKGLRLLCADLTDTMIQAYACNTQIPKVQLQISHGRGYVERKIRASSNCCISCYGRFEREVLVHLLRVRVIFNKVLARKAQCMSGAGAMGSSKAWNL